MNADRPIAARAGRCVSRSATSREAQAVARYRRAVDRRPPTAYLDDVTSLVEAQRRRRPATSAGNARGSGERAGRHKRCGALVAGGSTDARRQFGSFAITLVHLRFALMPGSPLGAEGTTRRRRGARLRRFSQGGLWHDDGPRRPLAARGAATSRTTTHDDACPLRRAAAGDAGVAGRAARRAAISARGRAGGLRRRAPTRGVAPDAEVGVAGRRGASPSARARGGRAAPRLRRRRSSHASPTSASSRTRAARAPCDASHRLHGTTARLGTTVDAARPRGGRASRLRPPRARAAPVGERARDAPHAGRDHVTGAGEGAKPARAAAAGRRPSCSRPRTLRARFFGERILPPRLPARAASARGALRFFTASPRSRLRRAIGRRRASRLPCRCVAERARRAPSRVLAMTLASPTADQSSTRADGRIHPSCGELPRRQRRRAGHRRRMAQSSRDDRLAHRHRPATSAPEAVASSSGRRSPAAACRRHAAFATRRRRRRKLTSRWCCERSPRPATAAGARGRPRARRGGAGSPRLRHRNDGEPSERACGATITGAVARRRDPATASPAAPAVGVSTPRILATAAGRLDDGDADDDDVLARRSPPASVPPRPSQSRCDAAEFDATRGHRARRRRRRPRRHSSVALCRCVDEEWEQCCSDGRACSRARSRRDP